MLVDKVGRQRYTFLNTSISNINSDYNSQFFSQRNNFVNTKPMCENKKVVSSENDKFSFKEAGINLGKGLISPITVMIQHPLKTLGVLAATGAATLVMPALVPIMLVGFGGYSLYELGKGIAVAGKEYKNGNYKASENAFQSTLQSILLIPSPASSFSDTWQGFHGAAATRYSWACCLGG